MRGEEVLGFGYCKGLQVRMRYLVSISLGNGMSVDACTSEDPLWDCGV